MERYADISAGGRFSPNVSARTVTMQKCMQKRRKSESGLYTAAINSIFESVLTLMKLNDTELLKSFVAFCRRQH